MNLSVKQMALEALFLGVSTIFASSALANGSPQTTQHRASYPVENDSAIQRAELKEIDGFLSNAWLGFKVWAAARLASYIVPPMTSEGLVTALIKGKPNNEPYSHWPVALARTTYPGARVYAGARAAAFLGLGYSGYNLYRGLNAHTALSRNNRVIMAYDKQEA